jgi:polysaccharide export outer membrane protein
VFIVLRQEPLQSVENYDRWSSGPAAAIILACISILSFVVPAFGQTESASQAHLVHFGDLIEVDVVGSYEFDWRGSLTPEGYLDGLEFFENQIYALCTSESDLSLTIRKEFSKTLRDPKVVVRILDRSNRAVAFLSGAVRTPARFQIKRPVYLNELLVRAGGITDRSSGEISIFRPANLSCMTKGGEGEFVKASQPGGAERINLKISDILRGDPSANPRILSGDIISVSEAMPVYVIGGVNSPQAISIRNRLTLSRAIAMAGGLSKESKAEITIFRRDAGNTNLISANLDRIAAGQAEDPVMKAFDIVDVPQKGRPPRARPPVIDSAASSVSLAASPLRIID